MASAKKLPSGSWRTQATRIENGKRIVKSFTVSPAKTGGDSRRAKQKSELLAREWQLSHDDDVIFSKTILQVLEDYIGGRSKVLSPRTIYDYRKIVPLLAPLHDVRLNDITAQHIQPIINEWSLTISRKTIQNRISFLLAALDYADCDKRFKLRYPSSAPKKVMAPDVQDVQRLLDNAPEDFVPVLCLAAFGTLRRGEISALKQKDISRDMCSVSVHADMVKTDNGWFYKDMPKTSGSIRTVILPKDIIDLLPCSEDPEAYVFPFNPNMIGHRYDKLRRKCDIDVNFHSLRHFAASFRSDIGVPRKYIEEAGGWSGDSATLQKVYDNTLTSTRKKYTQMTNKYIEETFNIKRSAQ